VLGKNEFIKECLEEDEYGDVLTNMQEEVFQIVYCCFRYWVFMRVYC